MSIDTLLREKKAFFDNYMQEYLAAFDCRPGLIDACAYSLQAGGKRLRPALAMLCCSSLGGDEKSTLPAGLAVEMVHTFSLIHDDLPAIDNDDLRRGQPTCHKKFGEANAILAGDALVFTAFNVISSSAYPADTRADIMHEFAERCGLRGLIQGEFEDVMAEGRELSLTDIVEIYRTKTCRLFELSMYAGARIAGGTDAQITALVDYGTHFGMAFQIIDDILDITSDTSTLGKTSGKDAIQDKATIVKSLGMDEARKWAERSTAKAIDSISSASGINPAHLNELAEYMLRRVM